VSKVEDATGFSRVEIQLEPNLIAERWSQTPSASAAWRFNFNLYSSEIARNWTSAAEARRYPNRKVCSWLG